MVYVSVESLLRAVKSAEDARQFWTAQQQLLVAVEAEEALITKRRCQVSRLQQGKKAHERSQSRNLASMRRFDQLISLCRWYEEQHALRRGALLYLGDTLAYRLLPEHYINVLCQNDRPGFFAGKKGRELEMKAAEFVAAEGDRALLHDLTHCLRVGDLSFVKSGFPPVVAEFETGRCHSPGHERRKARQHRRLELVGKVLGESVQKSDREELRRYVLPDGFMETDLQFEYHSQAFNEASRISSKGYTIVHPEEGLAYIATAPDCPPSEFMPKFKSEVRPGLFEFATLRKRVMGAYPWVPPITLLPIEESALRRYLDQEFRFFVYLDVDHLARAMGHRGIRLRPAFDACDVRSQKSEVGRVLSSWFMFEGETGTEWRVLIGPKLVHRVLFGLATLDSTVENLAQRASVGSRVAELALFRAGEEA